MKVGFVTTMHISEKYRPEGLKYIENYLTTLFNYMQFPFKVYIIDNGSEKPYDFEKWSWYSNADLNMISYTYIENQSISGITGAWNKGIYNAYKDDCDIICMTNDDILFNPTINVYIDFISKHDIKDISLYGPVTNGMLGGGIQKQQQPINQVVELSGNEGDIPNGFFFTFTNKFYEKFRHSNKELFALHHKHDGGDGKWGGQEGEFYRFKKEGARFFIVGYTWIYHHKIMGYRKTRNADREGNL